MLAVTGRPYDTLSEVIGDKTKNGDGLACRFRYLLRRGDPLARRKRGFCWHRIASCVSLVPVSRLCLSSARKDMRTARRFPRRKSAKLPHFQRREATPYVVVDNCYGEFCDRTEPTAHGADIVVGSLIKNPGGGMAQTGRLRGGDGACGRACRISPDDGRHRHGMRRLSRADTRYLQGFFLRAARGGAGEKDGGICRLCHGGARI